MKNRDVEDVFRHLHQWWLSTIPPGTIVSRSVLGRAPTYRKFIEDGEVTVSAYRTREGVLQYNGPVNPKRRAKKSVLYRIHVKRKPR